MRKQKNLLFFCHVFFFPWAFSAGSFLAKESSDLKPQEVPTKRLFVFGDSYADTGNWEKSASSWHLPYGITFPGEPSGRYSDGLILTDYVASFFGIPSPQPYRWRNSVNKTVLQHGMNFAYGGTGVFDTMVKEPNMTTQIDHFKSLLEEENVYTRQDLNSSVALVSLAGNDYAAFAMKHGDQDDLPSFTSSVINLLAHNLRRIRGLGVGKIAVTAMEPLGCLPQLTVYSSYENCSRRWNSIAALHNHKLRRKLRSLKNESKSNTTAGSSDVVILDLHKAFVSALKRHHKHQMGKNTSRNTLKPCCVGVTDEYSCGYVDDKGEKKYAVCNDPDASFFWDNIHPSQNGWRAVYSALGSTLYRLLH